MIWIGSLRISFFLHICRNGDKHGREGFISHVAWQGIACLKELRHAIEFCTFTVLKAFFFLVELT